MKLIEYKPVALSLLICACALFTHGQSYSANDHLKSNIYSKKRISRLEGNNKHIQLTTELAATDKPDSKEATDQQTPIIEGASNNNCIGEQSVYPVLHWAPFVPAEPGPDPLEKSIVTLNNDIQSAPGSEQALTLIHLPY